MKREIKFRGWDEENKKMFTDVQFIKSGDENGDWICFTSNEEQYSVEGNKIVFDSPYFSQQIHLMQFTGLKDKNGKEIYEGDILKCSDDNNRYMIFSDGMFQCNDGTRNLNSDEIIGNIYENPELLNEEQKDERSVATKAK